MSLRNLYATVVLGFAFCISAQAPAAADDHYLRGSQLVDLYTRYVFCYDPMSFGGTPTCSSIEEYDSATPSVLRILSHALVRFRARTPNSVGAALDDLILSGTSIKPEGYEAIDTQTQDIIANGLCRSKQTVVQDDYLLDAVMVADLAHPWANRAPASESNLEHWRANHAGADQNEIGNYYCSRYSVFRTDQTQYGPLYVLGEDNFIDGQKQPGVQSTVMLFPKGTSLTLRAP